MREVPFSKPSVAGTELDRVREAIEGGLSSTGPFTARCEEWLAAATGAGRVLLSHTGTGALEAAAMLAGLGPGDEAIMPSFGYPTMASAVVRTGARPVFVDIQPSTLNIDPAAVEAAIGPDTKAVVAVHYGGVACDMARLSAICNAHGLTLIEDAAHGLLASYRGRALGAIGRLGTFSFHHTKNVSCGEGGCLLVNDPRLLERAEIIWEKGTDRGRYARGEVDRYSWIDVGSSFGASELTAAFLYSQLEVARDLTSRRRAIWRRYHEGLAAAESSGLARRPVVPEGSEHNGHLYYLLLASAPMRSEFIRRLGESGVQASFHYTPLHSSPAGVAFGRCDGGLEHTERISRTLVRLPLFPDLDDEAVELVIETALAAVGSCAQSVVS